MSGAEMVRDAILSDDGLYRYVLTRRWDSTNPARATFVMLNPSLANGTRDDPTVLCCIDFSRSWGMGGLHIVNLNAFITPRPADLRKAEDPVGPDNDVYLGHFLAESAWTGWPVVAAWGNNAHPDRVRHVMGLEHADRFRCLGTTKSGAPKHPLARGVHRIPRDAPLVPYRIMENPR